MPPGVPGVSKFLGRDFYAVRHFLKLSLAEVATSLEDGFVCFSGYCAFFCSLHSFLQHGEKNESGG